MELKNKFCEIKVNEHGAEIVSLVVGGKEFLSRNNDWNRTAPFLFPFIGVIKEGYLEIDNKKYKIGRHGFLRDMKFKLTNKDDKIIASTSFKANDVYPFDFEVEVIYELLDTELNIIFDVKCDDKMHYNIGWHPAFTIDDFYINSESFYENEEGIITTRNENTFKHLCKNSVVDGKTYIFDWFDCELIKDGQIIKLSCDANQLALWTCNRDQFFSIEPWFKSIDKINSSTKQEEKGWFNGNSSTKINLKWG